MYYSKPNPCPPLRRDLLKLRCEEKSYGVRLTSPRDGEGHGDSFSALSLALLVGHELAGKVRVDAGALLCKEIDNGHNHRRNETE